MKNIIETDKKEILSKYNNTNNDVFNYLRRNFKVLDLDTDLELFISKKMISIDDKTYIVQDNKNFLKEKLLNYVNERFPNINTPDKVRTIKKFIDFILIS